MQIDHTPFKLESLFSPAGDQPAAIEKLAQGVEQGCRDQILLGVTGSGKTFTMAGIVARVQRPTLVIAPNKILAAQLFSEFKDLFPHNAVEYFVSYYDYYQPEAYIPQSDTYIEKDSSINDVIDKLRHSATRSLLSRRDTIIVASVSCIYGIGSVETYTAMTFAVQVGEQISQRQFLADLVALQYRRNDGNFHRGTFRVRGDTVELFPAHLEDRAWRISLFGDEIENIEVVPAERGIIMRLDPVRRSMYAECVKSALPDRDDQDARRWCSGIVVHAAPCIGNANEYRM